MLRACRRVLKPGGRIAYYTIFISEELPAETRRQIGKLTPAGVYTRARQHGLLRSAGFVAIEEADVSDAYLQVQHALYEASERHARGLRRALGATAFEERQRDRQRGIRAIEAGVLRRSLFVAERPAATRQGR